MNTHIDKFSGLFAELFGKSDGSVIIGGASAPEVHTFPNGFRIIHEKPKSAIPITSIHVFCDVGSIRESDKDSRGISHFIEHMCFKGTKKVPVPRDIFLEFDKHGASFNATTDKRYTYYTVKTNDEHIDTALQTLGDMMLNSTFSKAQFKREEKVVIEENIKNSDDPADMLSELVDAELYAGTPVGAPIDTLAYHKTPFDHATVLEFYHRFYLPQNMILSIVSSKSLAQIVRLVQSTDFCKPRASINVGGNIPNNTQTALSGPRWILHKKPDINTAHISISFRTCSYFAKDKYTLNLLRNILSSSMSSRLFTVLREKNGLTYSSTANTAYHECGGDFAIYVEVDKTKIMHNNTKDSPGKNKGVIPILVD